ncbi:hypothetical protein [Lambdina fiscellaria nucleopolyhedrovirus]|uniref:Uncharacterized protein n=1 Tax=Lambdina fiscellaria nucleopolyhedrovirus TaxID=1642929 RepID=A0A0E3URC3_9ABAC|nr:hypothetical protein [Lambdina fiscellaria nucleopolyhedrovirus]AKC91715.1 hypothetical protein [Lambdina fiscellaria nucleopolyhedrovirus]
MRWWTFIVDRFNGWRGVDKLQERCRYSQPVQSVLKILDVPDQVTRCVGCRFVAPARLNAAEYARLHCAFETATKAPCQYTKRKDVDAKKKCGGGGNHDFGYRDLEMVKLNDCDDRSLLVAQHEFT